MAGVLTHDVLDLGFVPSSAQIPLSYLLEEWPKQQAAGHSGVVDASLASSLGSCGAWDQRIKESLRERERESDSPACG